MKLSEPRALSLVKGLSLAVFARCCIYCRGGAWSGRRARGDVGSLMLTRLHCVTKVRGKMCQRQD